MTQISNSNPEYISFLTEVKERIRDSQYKALKSVNKELIQLYWDIGRMIVEKQQHLGWGKSVVEQFSKDIRKEYPGIQGIYPLSEVLLVVLNSFISQLVVLSRWRYYNGSTTN
jgi:isocitrate dehydrogenase kinase/phosphatase